MAYISYIRQGHDSLTLTELGQELDRFSHHLLQSFSTDTRQ